MTAKTTLAHEIRQYLQVSEEFLCEGLRKGMITVEEAKETADDMAKWQNFLNRLTAEAT